SWALFQFKLLGRYNTFNHRALAAWIFCMIVMFATSMVTAPPPKEKTEGIFWNKSYMSLPPEERRKYRGLKDWRIWWALFVGIVLSIYAFFLWHRILHPWEVDVSEFGKLGLKLLTTAIIPPLIAGLYLAPLFVAYKCNHNNRKAIAAVNILFGWTLVGWVVSLAWGL